MAATLKELLTEYAEQARPYEVREQALRRGRRRRRMRVAVPAALAILSIVATGLTLVTLGPPVAPTIATPPPWQEVDPWRPQHDWPAVPSLPAVVIEELERMRLPGYPAEIVTDPDAPPLPSDRAVGRGLYHYTNPAGPWYGLVTESGAQYRLGPLDGATHGVSPGGRWLLIHSRAEATLSLRDLTGTAVTALPDPGTRTDGTVVLRPLGGDRLGDVVLVDPATGDGRTVSIDLSAAATPAELDVTAYIENLSGLGGDVSPLRPLPDGSLLLQLWRSFGGSPNFGMTIQTDVLVLDLDAGVVRERWRLPEPRLIPDNPRGDWESWRIEAVRPEGLLLAHRSTNGCGPGSSTARRAAPCPWSPTCAASPARSRTRSRG